MTSGSVMVEVEGQHELVEYHAPNPITIKAEHQHRLIATSPNTTVWCLWVLRNEAGELIDHFEGDTSPYEHTD